VPEASGEEAPLEEAALGRVRQAHRRQAQDADVRLREQLISQLAVYREIRPARVTVVFDSHPRGRPYPITEEHLGVEVVYSGPDTDADETIKEMVRQSDHRRDMVVVTSDADLQTICRRLGAQVVDSSAFRARMLRQLRRHKERRRREPLVKEEGVPDSEVDAWLEDLGLTDESPEEGGSR